MLDIVPFNNGGFYFGSDVGYFFPQAIQLQQMSLKADLNIFAQSLSVYLTICSCCGLCFFLMDRFGKIKIVLGPFVLWKADMMLSFLLFSL